MVNSMGKTTGGYSILSQISSMVCSGPEHTHVDSFSKSFVNADRETTNGENLE